jgi:hypothetical protein
MTTTTNTVWRWIKNDPPKPEDFPLIAWGMECERVIWTAHDLKFLHRLADDGRATHWRSIKCDPPPRELTQRERDAEAFKAWRKSEAHWADAAIPLSDVWHAALAWERGAVAEELFAAWLAYDQAERDYRTTQGFIRDFFRARREGGKP